MRRAASIVAFLIALTALCAPYIVEVPNLSCFPNGGTDPWTKKPTTTFLPTIINVDGITLREVLKKNGYDPATVGMDVQSVSVRKDTPIRKCTKFINGYGADLNTNFYTGLKAATNSSLDKSVCAVAFNKTGECLGDRSLLFSPPGTSYTLAVTFRRKSDGAVIQTLYQVKVKKPTLDDIRCNIDYFHRVAAGVTQKPKISLDVVTALKTALANPNKLSALFQFETVIGYYAIDFSQLAGVTNSQGKFDARFVNTYLIDSNEEPIGCLLIEMANAALYY